MKRWITLAVVTMIALNGCGGSGDQTAGGDDRVKIAYVTNGVDPFWSIAAAGVRAAAKDFDVDCEVLMPPKGLVDQKRMIESLLAKGIQGIAVSPIDAANQVQFLDEVAANTNLITQDSDAPDSNRICFIGMNNYAAGREAGKMMKDALPDGGNIMIFVGRLEQLNAQQRRQGVIDELLDRPIQNLDDLQVDSPGARLEGEKYTIIGTLTDNFDYAKAKSNAEDTIAANADINGMIGLFAYNMPACIEAVKEAGKLGQIKLASFDEDERTLQGIIDGHVQGTVSQQPYQYGYQSVRVLAGLARGDKSVLPEGGFLNIPVTLVTSENAVAFREELAKLKGGQ
ncbi:MAG: sugar ABC transporter substrate-binding protein [Candidatus Hydrogenedentota bacterium]|nr:MAG: sugar ABC transporter substrate-binding protein [Candidatus Hydrogenedentota bacterium]